MNPISIVGAILALLGAIFAILLMTEPSFVEIFIALEDFAEGEDGALTDVVGFVGVYKSEYDEAKITPEEAENITVLPGKYATDTTEFPLLFPAQTNFLDDIYPLSADALGAIPGVAPATLAALGGLLEQALPEFSDCDKYFDEVEAGQSALLTAITPLLEGVFDQLWQSFSAAFPALYDPTASTFQTHVLVVQAYFAEELVANCGLLLVDSNLVYSNYATQKTCVATTFNTKGSGLSAVALTLPEGSKKQALIAAGGYFQALAGLVSTTATCAAPTSFISCTYGNVELVPTEKLDEDWVGGGIKQSPCIFQGLPACPVGESVAQITATVRYMLDDEESLKTVNDGVFADVLTALGSVTGIVTTFLSSPPTYPNITLGYLTEVNDVSDYSTVHNELVKVVPPTFAENSPVCDLYVALGQIPAPTPPGNCNFLYLLDNAQGLLADAVPSLGPLIGQIISLYGQCVTIDENGVVTANAGITPSECPQFWPSIFVHLSYLNALEPSAYFAEGPSAVYDQAVAKCKDDDEDIAAISLAQVLTPIATALAIVASLLGLAGGIAEKGLAQIMAGCTSVLAGVFVLAALLTVRAAPIYSSVGGDAEQGSPLYLAGFAQLCGLVSIGATVLGGFALIVSAKLNPCAGNPDQLEVGKTASI